VRERASVFFFRLSSAADIPQADRSVWATLGLFAEWTFVGWVPFSRHVLNLLRDQAMGVRNSPSASVLAYVDCSR
jgi:hypothetical protein